MKRYTAVMEAMAKIRGVDLNEGMHKDDEEVKEAEHSDEEEVTEEMHSDEEETSEGHSEDHDDEEALNEVAALMDKILADDDAEDELLDEDYESVGKRRRDRRMAFLKGVGLATALGLGAAAANPGAAAGLAGQVGSGARSAMSNISNVLGSVGGGTRPNPGP